jgi:hypothetical protein
MAPSKDDGEGQSETAKAWVARRDAVDKAARAIHDADTPAQRRMPPRIESSGGNPAPFLIGIVALTLALVIFGWFFLDRMQCDPVFMDRGLTSACR